MLHFLTCFEFFCCISANSHEYTVVTGSSNPNQVLEVVVLQEEESGALLVYGVCFHLLPKIECPLKNVNKKKNSQFILGFNPKLKKSLQLIYVHYTAEILSVLIQQECEALFEMGAALYSSFCSCL